MIKYASNLRFTLRCIKLPHSAIAHIKRNKDTISLTRINRRSLIQICTHVMGFCHISSSSIIPIRMSTYLSGHKKPHMRKRHHYFSPTQLLPNNSKNLIFLTIRIYVAFQSTLTAFKFLTAF